jgi:hypothetical protein
MARSPLVLEIATRQTGRAAGASAALRNFGCRFRDGGSSQYKDAQTAALILRSAGAYHAKSQASINCDCTSRHAQYTSGIDANIALCPLSMLGLRAASSRRVQHGDHA